jgi:hypothetical protein
VVAVVVEEITELLEVVVLAETEVVMVVVEEFTVW